MEYSKKLNFDENPEENKTCFSKPRRGKIHKRVRFFYQERRNNYGVVVIREAYQFEFESMETDNSKVFRISRESNLVEVLIQ